MAQMDQSSIDTFVAEAEAGIPDAQYSLGLLYSTGHDAPLDYISAHKWLNIAGMKGNMDARRLLRGISSWLTSNPGATLAPATIPPPALLIYPRSTGSITKRLQDEAK